MQAKISPSPIASARYRHRQVIDKVRPAVRIDRKASLAVAIAALESDFHNAVSFSLSGQPCLSTLGSITFGGLGKTNHLGQSDRQALIARLLVLVNEISNKSQVVPIPQNHADGLLKTIEERARQIVDAGVVAVENNAATLFEIRWLPDELLATAIANISKAVALIYSLGAPPAHMPELQHLLNGQNKCKALSLLIKIGWHLDRLEDLLRPIFAMPSSESALIDLERKKNRDARARETTLIVVHPQGEGVTYWSLWRLANHAFVAPHSVLESSPTAVVIQ